MVGVLGSLIVPDSQDLSSCPKTPSDIRPQASSASQAKRAKLLQKCPVNIVNLVSAGHRMDLVS
eukprot:1179331-Prorocentrum_minimum.AAC.2